MKGLELNVGFTCRLASCGRLVSPTKLLGTLAVGGRRPRTVVIEVTESTAMTDPERTRDILQYLHDAGFQIAIDDFGTGYSSLARLQAPRRSTS